MAVYPDEKQYLRATPLMYKYFGETFQELKENPIITRGVNGKKIRIFDPEKFKFASFVTLATRNIVPGDQLTSFQVQTMHDPILIEYLTSLRRYLQYVLKFYRDMKKEERERQNR